MKKAKVKESYYVRAYSVRPMIVRGILKYQVMWHCSPYGKPFLSLKAAEEYVKKMNAPLVGARGR